MAVAGAGTGMVADGWAWAWRQVGVSVRRYDLFISCDCLGRSDPALTNTDQIPSVSKTPC